MFEKTTKLFYTDILTEKITLFVTTQWEVDELYTLTEVGSMFNIDIRHARYYLMKWVTKGVLCQITFDDATYYAWKCWAAPFRLLGCKVIDQ